MSTIDGGVGWIMDYLTPECERIGNLDQNTLDMVQKQEVTDVCHVHNEQ